MNSLQRRSRMQATLQSVLPCLLVATLVYGTFSCKSDAPADQGAKRGATDPKCNTLPVEKCTPAECTAVGKMCSGTPAYCAGFKNNLDKCPASCQIKTLDCVPLEDTSNTPVVGSAEYCKKYSQKTSCPSTCEWNASSNPPSCTAISQISNQVVEDCFNFRTEATCTGTTSPGTCEWIRANNTCQKRGSEPITPNPVNNNCASVNILMCFLTQGCTIKIALPPICGPKL